MGNNKFIKHWLSLFPLLIILAGYVSFISIKYWMFPVTNDGLLFSYLSAFPQKSSAFFTYSFNFYLTKMIAFPFNNLLLGYAFASLLYHIGTIIFAYLIARRLAGKIQGVLAAILTALCPFFFVFATEYFSEIPCLFFGFGALYFSLIRNNPSTDYIKYFLCGFLLTASLFSNPFGIIFIIPVFINLWSVRFLKKIIFFGLGILGVISFIALNDHIWLGDFFYHLNHSNYLVKINDVARRFSQLSEISAGRPQSLISHITSSDFIAYLIFFAFFLFQCLSACEFGNQLDWKKKGSFSLILTGLSLAIIFSLTSFFHDGWWVKAPYCYLLFIPWVVAFCSILRFTAEPESVNKWISKPDIISGFLSILFIIALFSIRMPYQITWGNSSFRFFHLVSLWILIFATALVLVAGNYIHRNGFRKIAVFVFLTGCFGIFWHNANWATKYSIESNSRKELYPQTKSFLEKYHELSQKFPIVPINCEVSRSYEVEISLLLSRLSTRKDLKFFDGIINLQETLKTLSAPFYILTKHKVDFLTQEANAIGLRVLPVPEGTYFDLKFYLIETPEKIDMII